MTHTPTNATVAIHRLGLPVEGMTALPCLILPARPEIVATREVPATKAYEVFFKAVIETREQDFIVHGSDRYKVVSVAHYRTPRAAHTEVVAEAIWGSD